MVWVLCARTIGTAKLENIPFGLVVKNASDISSKECSPRPGPESHRTVGCGRAIAI
jgi:hypothetical protein